MKNKNYSEKLYEKIWKTKGARFIAHRRLEQINQLSVWAIALNSVYVIITSLLSISPFSNYSKIAPEYLSLITIFFSLIIIVLSLIENSKNYKAKAESLHQCGKDLNKLYERLSQLLENNEQNSDITNEIEKLGEKYQVVIDKYPENHLSIDYDLFVASHKDLYDNKFLAFLIRAKIWVYVRLPYYLAILIPFILIISIIKCNK